MRAVPSCHPVLVLFCILTVSVLGGGLLAGCGSSSTSASGGGTIRTPDESDQGTGSRAGETQEADDRAPGDQQEDRPMGSDVSARGRVIYPDTTVVSSAQVWANPTVGETVKTDSAGWFKFTESFPEGEYTFNALDPKEGREGKTTVRVAGRSRIQETVWIVVGVGEKSLEAISIDSVRANPGGTGLKRTGN